MRGYFKIAATILVLSLQLGGNALTENSNGATIVAGDQKNTIPDDNFRKLFARHELEEEGFELARHQRYLEAMVPYQKALSPELIAYEFETATAKGAIINLYERLGKFEEALKRHLQRKAPQDGPDWPGIDQEFELKALIKARDSFSNKPIYEHINYLRNKYKKFVPPQSQGDSGFHSVPINEIIHLYDYMGDANGGIKFMTEVLSSKTLYAPERKEYERVKTAFEEDVRTGQKGHLQKVIETSDFISW